MKRRVAGLKIKHDGTYNSGGYVRQGVTPTDDPRTSPGRLHPLVCTHPETGRRSFISAAGATPISKGLELADSEALLDEIWELVAAREFAWEHVWQVGDLVLWDNRCTMHRRDAFDARRRIMHRTQIKGERGAGLMFRRLSVSNTVLLIICIRLCTNAGRYSHVPTCRFSSDTCQYLVGARAAGRWQALSGSDDP